MSIQGGAPVRAVALDSIVRRADPALQSALRRRRQQALQIGLARAGGLAVPLRAPVEVAGITHTSFELRKDGLPVFNRRPKRHEGAVAGASGELRLPPRAGAWSGLSRAAAIERAARFVDLRIARSEPSAERGWFALEDRTVAAWQVILPARDPFGTWQVLLDARSGEVLAALDRMLRVQGTGSVYVPNVVQSGGVPSQVPLFDLDDSGFLGGRVTRVIDERAVEAFRPDNAFAFLPADPRFVQTSVYRSLTDTARLFELRGFPPFTTPVHAFVNLAGPGGIGEYNNAFYYDSFFRLFGFGNGDGVVLANVGTDSDVASHEMGHHLFETLAEPLALFTSDPVLAMNEGFGDAVAALWNGDPNVGESVVPGQPYMRTLANVAIYPDDVAADPHETGLIYGGLLWSLRQSIGPIEVGEIAMAGLPFLPAQPDPWDFPAALVSGDQAVNGGVNVATINAAANARGLVDPFPPEFQGELVEGSPQSRGLTNGAFHVFVFFEFPGSPSVTFSTTGTGDVDLYVAPLVLSGDINSYLISESFTSFESVTFNTGSFPSVNADDAYLVVVQDYPDDFGSSSYTLSVANTLPAAQIAIPGMRSDSLVSADEIDLFIVNGVAGQVLRVEVNGITPGLDLFAAVFDPKTPDLLGANDDSGPGLNPLIQGARFAASKPYALAVFSALGDVDPGVGTGSYTILLSQCTNTGANSDGDLLVDACDDDDDNDGFLDDIDTAPTSGALCADVDADTCDDCATPPFDPFTDGPDFDNDATCDAGDVDRDNDGCQNASDPAPLGPSTDVDLDFLGADCDNCPAVSNPSQADTDGDAAGDACDPCPTSAGSVDPDMDAVCAADNCPAVFNPDQSDTGGFASFAPDGVGTACQCAEVSGDGNVSILDAVWMARFVYGYSATLPFPARCAASVGGLCDEDNWYLLRYGLAGILAAGANGCLVP